METILIILERVARMVHRGRVFECIYTPATIKLDETVAQQCLIKLRDDLVTQYASVLVALDKCYSTLSKHPVVRIAGSIFNFKEIEDILNELEKHERHTAQQAEDCGRMCNYQVSTELLDHLRDIFPHLGEIRSSVEVVKHQLAQVFVLVNDQERRKTLQKISDIPYLAHHDEGKSVV